MHAYWHLNHTCTQAHWYVNHAGTQARWHVDHVDTKTRMIRDLGNSERVNTRKGTQAT